jgi:ABC-type transport system substrate-binding protein
VKAYTDVTKYYDALHKASKTSPNAGLFAWQADYPAPSNFFELVSCRKIGDVLTNTSGYCSPELEKQIDRALALQSRDQAAAARLWTRVDRAATDTAAIVPFETPKSVDLVSKRVGNYQHHPLFGVLLDQLWVR